MVFGKRQEYYDKISIFEGYIKKRILMIEKEEKTHLKFSINNHTALKKISSQLILQYENDLNQIISLNIRNIDEKSFKNALERIIYNYS